MYARLNRFIEMEWEPLAASLEWFRGEPLQRLEQRPGFRTLFFGVNREQGKAAGITFWDTTREMQRGERDEKKARLEALRRAGADESKGLVDNYEIKLELAGGGDAQWARFSRWEGLIAQRIWDALDRFKEEDVPALEQTPGFAGMFVGVNKRLGKVMSAILWDSPETLAASLEWEREARARAESTSGPQRSVIADSYEVALAPELHTLEPRSG